MTEDEEKFTLRDKLAIELLKLSYNNNKESIFSEYIRHFTIDKNDSNNDFSDGYIQDLDSFLSYEEKQIVRKFRGAYKLADLMRKVRLGAFE